MPSRITHRAGEVARELRERARRTDPMVGAAALTCYAAFGVVPLLAIGVRVSAWCFGADRLTSTARGLARYLHGPLHLGDDVVAFTRSAAGSPWWTVLVALVPVSLYAEGIVRTLQRFSRAAPERRSRTLRGRLLTPVLTLLAVLFVVVTVGLLRRLLFDPFGTGLGGRLLGVFVAFNILFFAVFGSLLLVYRLFAGIPLRRGALAFAAFAAASWISGQSLGYTVALRLISGFARAFGGYAPAGEVAALAFFVYLLHLVLVLGYLLALVLHDSAGPRPAAPSGRADVAGHRLRREGDQRQAAAGVGGPADEEQAASA